MAISCPYTLHVYRGAHGFQQLKPHWEKMRPPAQAPGFYHCAEWYEAVVECLDAHAESFRFYCVFQNEQLVAVFPFKRYTRRFLGLPVDSLELLKHSHLPLADIVLPPSAHTQSIWSFFMSQLRQHPTERWDYLRFQKVPENSDLSFVLSNATEQQVIQHRMRGCFHCARASQQELSQRISRSFRKSLRNAQNRLSKLGTPSFCTAQTPAEMDSLFQQFLQLEASGWKAREGTAIAQDGRQKAFYQKLISTFGPEHCLLLVLRVDEQPIAASFDLMIGSTLYALKVGIDDQFRFASPGQLITEREATDAGAPPDQIDTLNFVSEAAGASFWRPQSLNVLDICILNTTWRAQLIRAQISLKYSVRRAYRRTLKPLVKKLQRKPNKNPRKTTPPRPRS